jgi:hypothetical protein
LPAAPGVALDRGTGDGLPRTRSGEGASGHARIGVDANAAVMAGSSRRAARSEALPNARLAVAAAEQPPLELDGVAVAGA